MFPLSVFFDYVYLVSSRLTACDPFFKGMFGTSIIVICTTSIETALQPSDER